MGAVQRVTFVAGALAAIAALVLLSSCRSRPGRSAFVLRDRAAAGVAQAVEQRALDLHSALGRELGVSGLLEPGYPVSGAIVLTPDPEDPNRSTISCEPGATPGDLGSHGVCLVLSPQGSFARIRAITWQSAAVFQHRLYVVPRSLLARVDPTRDFVAVDLHAYDEPDLFMSQSPRIAAAMESLGARPTGR